MMMATSVIPPMQEEPILKPALQILWLPFELNPSIGGHMTPVECADNWIQAEMIREPWHPIWWKELKGLYRDSAGNLSDTQTLQLAWQQPFSCLLPRRRQ